MSGSQILAERYPARRKFVGNHNANKTHCANGHELSGSNITLRRREKDGWAFVERRCIACRAFHSRGRGRK